MNSASRHFNWSFPVKDWELSEEDIHIWVVDLERTSRLPELAATLSSDEKERAARFHFQPDRNKYIAGRGLLRTILSRYTEVLPANLKFKYEDNGKPHLADASQFGNLNFNLSHSEGLAVYGITRGREIGIDLEIIRALPDMDDVAARCFLPEEQAALRFLESPRKEKNFFRCWTRKEAQLKCSGEGFSTEPGIEKAFDGSLLELKPSEGYIGALAVRGRPFALKTWQWVEAS